jgi:hypothetical protein
MGALLGDDVLEAGPGDLVFKPRGEWHTFWNASEDPCRILEIIAPAGFERFFSELVDLGGVTQADPDVLGSLCRRYQLQMDPRACSVSSSASVCASRGSRSSAERASHPDIPSRENRCPPGPRRARRPKDQPAIGAGSQPQPPAATPRVPT